MLGFGVQGLGLRVRDVGFRFVEGLGSEFRVSDPGLTVKRLGFKEFKGTLLGTPNREPQEYSRCIIGIYLPGSLYSIIFLLYS